MKSYGKISFLVLLIIFSPVWGYCQTEHYKFRHLTIEDGLPSNFCWNTMKDSAGFVWITTRAGICRYDGYNIKVYQYTHLDSTSLSDNRIAFSNGMLADKAGNLWIGTNNGLNKFNPLTESFERFQHHPQDLKSISSNRILCLYIDKEDNLWIGTAGGRGLNRYLPEYDQFKSYNFYPDDTIHEVPSIWSIYQDHAGFLWIGTTGSLYKLEIDKGNFERIRLSPELPETYNPYVFKCIREDSDGKLVFGTQFGFLVYDDVKKELLPYESLFDAKNRFRWLDFLPVTFDKGYTHWIIYNHLLHQFNKHNFTLTPLQIDLQNPFSLHGIVLKSIFRDESGMIWISGELGVNIMNPSDEHLNDSHNEFGVKNNNATSFLEDHAGDLWIGAEHLIQYDKKMNLVNSFEAFPLKEGNELFISTVWSLFEDGNMNKWIGTDKNGLYLLSSGSSKLISCDLIPGHPDFIYCIYADTHGIIWIGTNRGLFYQKAGESTTMFYQASSWGSLNNTTILDINEDHYGNLWIGTTSEGLFCQTPELRDHETFINYKLDPEKEYSLSNNWVWSVYEDNLRDLWIATEHGLNKFIREENHFKRYINDADLGSNFIYDLTGDDKGNLWMTTESGLIRFNPEANTDNATVSNRYKQILPFIDIFPYRIYRNKSGEIFVGGANSSGKGYYRFFPDSLKENKNIPPISIIDFKVHNITFLMDTSITLKKHIYLNYNQNFFSFEFTAMDFVDPEKNQFAYYMDGFEENWIYSGNRRFANYTGVPPGNYIFRVKGSNNDGYWNETGKSVSITILSPPWKTFWAYAVYGVLLIGLIFGWRRYDLKRQKLKQDLELEHVEAKKLKELDTLKSRFFSNISHEFRTPLTLILGPLEKLRSKITDGESKRDLNMMHRNAMRLQNLINQLLSLSKLESGKMKLQVREENIVSLVNGYAQSFESLAKQKKIDFIFISTEKSIPVYVDRDKLEKILYNLLSNAFKFTDEGGRIEIVVSLWPLATRLLDGLVDKADEKLVANGKQPTTSASQCAAIKISDTGCGIPPDKLIHIFDRFYQADDSFTKAQEGSGIGLALTKELVELLHGEIFVESELKKGTKITIFLPIGKEHFSPEEIVNETEIQSERARSLQPFPELDYIDKSFAPSEHQYLDEIDDKAEKPYLLIVDDNTDLRDYMRSCLYKDYHIMEAREGEEGFNKAAEKIPDLIISDVMMPKIDGYELCQKLKTDERTSHIPVILLTARASQESKIEGLVTGADDFIAKPFDEQELNIRAKNLIKQRAELKARFQKEISYNNLLNEEKVVFTLDQQFLIKAKNVVENYLLVSDFSIEEFAREMSLSRMQLHRKLKALVNQSASGFIRTIRVNKAAELLDKRSATVSEIAFAVGFNTLSYFTKCFQDYFGVNPSEYADRNSKI